MGKPHDKKLEQDTQFLAFLRKEVDKTAVNATARELANFAFGSLEDAINTFKGEKNAS